MSLKPVRRVLVNLAWVGLGVLLTWGLLANPLGLSGLDTLRYRLLGDRPAPSAEAPGEHAGLWTCGMHPEVIQEEPGRCPICHMDLVPLRAEGAGHSVAAHAEGVQQWTCPMHPEIVEDEPGSCPICHMDLVPREPSAQEWTCPMHPEIVEGEPGSCPICHMDLVPKEPAEPAERVAESGSQLWTCGMHPEVIQDEPGSCPICHMDLVPLRKDATSASAPAPGQGATVTIDPAIVQNMNVLTAVAEEGELSREIRTVGYLEYDQQKMVSVTTKYPGWIEKVFVNYVGEPVRKGQPLFEIYSPELVQTEQDLLSAIQFARRMADATADAHQRALDLVEASRQRLAYWDVTEEQIRRLEETGKVFRTLTVVAPASGVVMMRMPGLEGRAVQPGMELFHIADMSSLWLSVEAFENQIRWLQVGSVAEVSLSYFPGEAFKGRVRFIEPQINEATRTVPLKLEVPNRGGRLRAGMYATVRFEPVVARDAVLVPAPAVLRTGQRNLVVVAEGGGRFTPREVQLGVEGDGRVEIRDGLEPGDEVVTSAQFLIDSESNLREAVQKLIAARGADAEPPPAPGHRH
jgi:Cu(I)/Ag(I) efflux system membrane fusion protein/cobalt-zinc-cadmium efflux system membrane fusion protein